MHEHIHSAGTGHLPLVNTVRTLVPN